MHTCILPWVTHLLLAPPTWWPLSDDVQGPAGRAGIGFAPSLEMRRLGASCALTALPFCARVCSFLGVSLQLPANPGS